MARNEELQEKLCNAGWDLVVFDEAHKLAAHFFGNKLEKTGRFKLAERLGAQTRHLLLMTATPHNGKEEDFQLFLSLLDSDRFYGKFRDGVHKVDCSDLIRRMVKEKLVKFDGTPLFPERRAYTVNYQLSDLEVALYETVTDYVKTEMGARGQQILAETLADVPEDDDDLNAEEQENLEETLVDQATAWHKMHLLVIPCADACKGRKMNFRFYRRCHDKQSRIDRVIGRSGVGSCGTDHVCKQHRQIRPSDLRFRE